ncbi:hypothetical protein GCM10029976_038860 [Kribbella albertanoniae]|uniref:Uncharacterized protein n=1 Tax=Kribbella albertanoniae TaxID=1266829 RepID=A0A4R4PZS5_9ACTN|nr:hypothetical protein [Kribbella albertanoniae]TDC28117.1 hypothetical protein E1261_19490 [Kribbella albertanoniae]
MVQDRAYTAWANMFQYYAENHEAFTGSRNLDAVRELNPHLQSFDTWLNLHKDELKAVVN